MKHKIAQGAIVGISLALIAATATDALNLEYHANEMNPIEEIVVVRLKPDPIFDTIVNSRCKNELGQAQLFIDCMLKLKRQYGK